MYAVADSKALYNILIISHACLRTSLRLFLCAPAMLPACTNVSPDVCSNAYLCMRNLQQTVRGPTHTHMQMYNNQRMKQNSSTTGTGRYNDVNAAAVAAFIVLLIIKLPYCIC